MTMMATERELVELKEKFCGLVEDRVYEYYQNKTESEPSSCDLCPVRDFCKVGANGFLKFLTDNVKTYMWEDEQ